MSIFGEPSIGSNSISFRCLAELVIPTFLLSGIPIIYVLYFPIFGNLDES